MGIWRNGLLPVGVVLVLLGLGNWIIASRKVSEYGQLLARSEQSLQNEDFSEFHELSERTNSTLLRPFRSTNDATSLIGARLDLYQIVHTGGRLLMLAGWFAMAAGIVHFWYRRRLGGRHGSLPQHS